jgi:hypothetical protein
MLSKMLGTRAPGLKILRAIVMLHLVPVMPVLFRI